MKKGWSIAALLFLVAMACWWGNRGSFHASGNKITSGSASETTGMVHLAEPAGRFRTKASDRADMSLATHRPERLKEFILPEVVIDGLTLDQALGKLMDAYEEACRRTGESSLDLRFVVPEGNGRKLHLRLSARSFQASLRLLATLSGMKVTRTDLEYRFEAIKGDQRVSDSIRVMPDIQSALAGLTDVKSELRDPFVDPEAAARMTVREHLNALGLGIDPSAKVTLAANGMLTFENMPAADAAAISILARTLSEEPKLQQKFNTKLLELPAGTDWDPAGRSELTDGEAQLLMREFAMLKGVDLRTMPSVTSKAGQPAVIEIVRELIAPSEESETGFEKHQIGTVVEVGGDPVGFGSDVNFHFTDTTGGLDAATGKAAIDKRTDLADSGFSSDGGTRLVVQTRADGSRTVLLMTVDLLDPTGRKIR